MSQKQINIFLTILLLSNLGFTSYRAFIERPFELPGKGLDEYDMTSPEAALSSIREMVTTFDLKAGLDYFRLSVKEKSDPLLDYLTVSNAELTVEKTHVIKDSSIDGSSGKILAFMKVVANGVETRDVQAFEKREGILMPSSFKLFEFNKDSWTQEDKYLWEVQSSWKTKGQLE